MTGTTKKAKTLAVTALLLGLVVGSQGCMVSNQVEHEAVVSKDPVTSKVLYALLPLAAVADVALIPVEIVVIPIALVNFKGVDTACH